MMSRVLAAVIPLVAAAVGMALFLPVGCVTSDCPATGPCPPSYCRLLIGLKFPSKSLVPALTVAALILVSSGLTAWVVGRTGRETR